VVKESIVSILTCVLLFTTLIMLFYAVPVSAGTLRVPEDYSTIQAAIDASKRGDVIQVSAGIYYEHVVINEEIKLMGANKETTIIDGNHVGNVVHVQVSAVTVTGFTVRNGNNGIRVMGTIGSVNVTGNIIRNNRYGISLIGDDVTSTTDNIIVGNTFQNNSNVSISISFGQSNTISQNDISGSAYGMKLAVTDTTTISDNLLTSNSYGIYVSYSTSNNIINNIGIDNSFGIYAVYSDNILIRDNRVNGSTYGIQLYGSYSSTILYNDVSDNPAFSIYLVYSNTSSVTNNTMSRNDWGLTLYDATSNTIEGNTISYNTFGITTNYSPSNTIYHNNFNSNVDQITRDLASTNTWSHDGQGNHWSDYQGVDDGSGGRVAGDGIGDTLIPHLGADYYPLMYTWPSAERDVAILGVYEFTNTAYAGQIIDFEVIVENEGPIAETFNVTLQNNVTVIEKRTVTSLAPNTNTSLIFNWDTSTVPPGYYLISATAEPVPGETDLTDNSKTDGTVRIKIPGDIDGDCDVDTSDFYLFSGAYGTSPPSDPRADLDGDGDVDPADFYLFTQNYGKTC
jgi:nitrous oxidase accessory protein